MTFEKLLKYKALKLFHNSTVSLCFDQVNAALVNVLAEMNRLKKKNCNPCRKIKTNKW